jgi:glycosyltransferase involved in cell wall biosynthesis
MRILWFTNSPSLGASKLGYKTIGSSWIESLESNLGKQQDIEIGIAFLWRGENAGKYKINKTTYYPIQGKPSMGKINRFFSRWRHKITTEENIENYLKVIRDFSPDIIHIFGTENDYGMLLSRINIPCIVYIQGSLILCNYKWYNGFTKKEVLRFSEKLKYLKGYGLIHSYFVFKKAAERERNIFKNSKYLIGRTDWDKRLSLVLSPDAKYFHCDEVMRPQFYSNKWVQPNFGNEKIIISVIRNSIYKGLETVFEAQKILWEQFPEQKIRWRVAGITANDEIVWLLEKKFKKQLNEIGLQLLGPLHEDELIIEMLKADIFVHPSHIENSPNSLCEAMLLGMPVIATAVGGVLSMLNDKQEGILIQDGDPYSMAGAVLELIANRNYAKKLGLNARSKAMEKHDPDKIANQLMTAYFSVLSQNKDA